MNNNFIAVADFCQVMDVDADMKHLLNARISGLAREGTIQRVKVANIWHYKESDLLDTLSSMRKQTSELPDDVMSVNKFVREHLPLNCYNIRDKICKRMSELGLKGDVKRYPANGRSRSWVYHLSDLERETAGLVKREDARLGRDSGYSPKPTKKHGIFVRMWHWFFGE